ncbi:MAG: type 4a pilus biogenesis protein PilO [Candidatus Nealsonbacteria bacterium]|nr:type 4a pilus biogenesis protein PilO [Candidatus Nealsonbacteria bacterium]
MNRPVAIIICLTTAIILMIALVFPKKGDLDSLVKKVNEKKAELQSKEEYFASLGQTAEDFKKYQQPLAKIGSALPQSSQLPALFDFLQKASSQTGMVLTNISPLVAKASGIEGGINENSVNLVVTGTYPAFRNFLSVLEKSSRLIEVQTASFSIQEKIPEFNLRIKVYSY